MNCATRQNTIVIFGGTHCSVQCRSIHATVVAVQCVVLIRFHLLGKSPLLAPRGARPLMAAYTLLCSHCTDVGGGGGGGVAQP